MGQEDACARCKQAEGAVAELQDCLDQIVRGYDREIKRSADALPFAHAARCATLTPAHPQALKGAGASAAARAGRGAAG